MKIGVISDTHGDLTAWQKAMKKHFGDAELILHAGDILYSGPKNPMGEGYGPANLAEALNASPAPIIFARGNCDSAVDQLVINYPIQAPYAFVQLDGLRMIVNHGDMLSQEEMAQQAELYHAHLFIFGHIHTPVLVHHGKVILLNPGSPTLPKSPFPTVATIDTESRMMSILDLNTRNVLDQTQIQG
jgi:uncharacterized protein